jgi:hypothetical protein
MARLAGNPSDARSPEKAPGPGYDHRRSAAIDTAMKR